MMKASLGLVALQRCMELEYDVQLSLESGRVTLDFKNRGHAMDIEEMLNLMTSEAVVLHIQYNRLV